LRADFPEKSTMPLKPDTLALTVLLALLTALGPLATDMYLAALPVITTELGSDVPQAQLTLSLFLAGFAGGQLIYGPISDRHGRRVVLLSSLAVVLLAVIGCMLAPNMEMLIAARFLHGAATAGPIVLARSIVRDLYSGTRAGQELSRMGSIMGLVPAVAPFFGALILEAAGWRLIFAAQTALAALTIAMVVVGLPETIGARRRSDPLRATTFLRAYGGLASSAVYRVNVAAVCVIYSGLFAFISTATFVLQGAYAVSPLGFALGFGLICLTYVAGTMVGTRLVPRIGLSRAMLWGSVIVALGGVLMPAAVIGGGGSHPAEVVGPMAIYMFGLGIAFPQAIAGAMTPFPDRAGAASSLLGFCQMASAAIIGAIVAHAFDGTGLPLALAVCLLGLAALGISLWERYALAVVPGE
jgi:DHA1 family bicyclomycin/chloramphenicol resistance-like MFS transporter